MIKLLFSKIKRLPKATLVYVSFLLLLLFFGLKGVAKYLNKLSRNRLGWLVGMADRWENLMNIKTDGDISRIYLIELAFRNMKTKKMRAMVTIGGVAVGVGAIVFLVSIGYGLEKMVISKVARLDELKIIDVSKAGTGEARMDEELVKKIRAINGVEEVAPVVSLVAKVKYKNSLVDLMSFGVDQRYLKLVDVKIVSGSEFKDKDGDFSYEKGGGKVAGVSQETVGAVMGEAIGAGVKRLNVAEGEKVVMWQECSRESGMVGLVIRAEGGYAGEEVWGERYYLTTDREVVGVNKVSGEEYSKWYRIKSPVWKVDGEGNPVAMIDGSGKRQWEIGCVMGKEVIVEDDRWLENSFDSLEEYLDGQEGMGKVMGVTKTATGSAVSGSNSTDASPSAELFEMVVATDSAGVEWVEMKKVGAVEEKKTVEFAGEPVGEAYVSLGMLKLFGLNKGNAVGQRFKVIYIVPESLLPGAAGSMLSEEVEYGVAGVTDDEINNYYYFQIADAKRLGIKNYSQLKVVLKSQQLVAVVRKEIETLGFKTVSTLDTVSQIESLFKTLRLLLGLLGTVGLAVAALGMFNTMTVSLLERTREVGAMKAMGMLSDEVKELFLAESMIMGVGGGTLGVTLGFLMGKLVSIGLTTVSVVKGQQVMDISYVPWFFVAFIMLISFLVGVATGWYPSKRARAISALNALRYE